MNKDRLKLAAAMVIFGTIGLVRRGIPYSSGMVALVRGVIGTLFLLALHFLRKEKFDRALLRRNLPMLAASGALIGFNWICLFEAYRYTTVSAATICYYMAPVFVLLVSPLVLKEKLTPRKAVCCAAAFAGMVLVSGVPDTGLGAVKGVLPALAAAVMYACVMLLNKKLTGLTAGERTIWQLGFAAAVLVPYVLLTEDLSALTFDAGALALLLTAGIVHTGLAYALYFGAMANLPAQTTALMSYIDPVVAVLLSALILREPMNVPGAALVLGAMLLSELEPKRG